MDPNEQLMRDLQKGQSGLRKSAAGGDSPRTRTRKEQQKRQNAEGKKPATAGWEEPFVERQLTKRKQQRQARAEFGQSAKKPDPAPEPKPDGFGEAVNASDPDKIKAARDAALATARRPSGTYTGNTGARYNRRLGRTVVVRPHAPFLARPS